MMHAESIAGRAIGAYPISIATSLAIESVAGIFPDNPVSPAPILKYSELWINVRTLYRNFIGALDRETSERVMPPEISEVLSEEMEQIVSIVREISEGKTKVVFYISNYADIETKYKHAVIRRDSTDKQKMYTASLNQTLAMLIKSHTPDTLQVFDLKIHVANRPSALIVTHIVYDLVVWKQFTKLVLLESHTGKMKEYAQWYTKYLNGKELSMMPFREDLLQVFGDHETFRPMDVRVRRELIEVAVKYRWSAITTIDKIKYGVDQMKNPYARDILKAILV